MRCVAGRSLACCPRKVIETLRSPAPLGSLTALLLIIPQPRRPCNLITFQALVLHSLGAELAKVDSQMRAGRLEPMCTYFPRLRQPLLAKREKGAGLNPDALSP